MKISTLIIGLCIICLILASVACGKKAPPRAMTDTADFGFWIGEFGR